MKRLLLAVIRFYWTMPRLNKGCCHFKETCSRYVYRMTEEQGFKAGLNAFKARYAQCRPNVAVITLDGTDFVVFQDKTIIERVKTNI